MTIVNTWYPSEARNSDLVLVCCAVIQPTPPILAPVLDFPQTAFRVLKAMYLASVELIARNSWQLAS